MEICPECGARLVSTSVQCDLCGWMIPSTAGKFLASSSEPAKHQEQVEQKLGHQVYIMFGVGALLVTVLFMATTVSKRVTPIGPATPPTSEVPTSQTPLSGELAERIREIDLAIARDTTSMTILLKREKVYTLVDGRRLDLAADLQREIALETQLVEDWKATGDLFYEQMTSESEPQRRTLIADQSINAYQQVLMLTPDNHDVRTDMSTAYLNTGNPMLGVTEIKKVLELDPNHLNANFNYGLMLARINRTEEAMTQLEIVLRLAPDPMSMHHQRASELMAAIQEQASP